MTASLTKIKMLDQCGAKYKYRYIDKLKEQQNEFAARGTEIHSQLENFILGKTERLDGKLEFYHGFLSQLRSHPIPIIPELRVAIRSGWVPESDETAEPWLVGYLDLFRTVEVSAHFWDWKTGKQYPSHDEDMELYALMVLAAYPHVEVVTATYTYVDLGKNRERIFSREFDWDKRLKWQAKIERMDKLQPFDLIPKPQFLCRYCGFSQTRGGPCLF